MSIVVLFSCSKKKQFETLSDYWILTNMEVDGNSVYPATKIKNDETLRFHPLQFSAKGYEQYEVLGFDHQEHTVIVPGFDSELLKLRYTFVDDSLQIYLDTALFNDFKFEYLDRVYSEISLMDLNDELKVDKESYKDSIDSVIKSEHKIRGLGSGQYDRALDIYCRNFSFILREDNFMLELSSPKVKIALVNQEEAFKRSIRDLIKNLQLFGMDENLPVLITFPFPYHTFATKGALRI